MPAVTGITLGIANQKGFNALNGRNQAFNHAGNMVGAALSGYLGYNSAMWPCSYSPRFWRHRGGLRMTIPAKAIDDRAARGSKEDDPDSPPSGLSILFEAQAAAGAGDGLALPSRQRRLVPLYGLAAVASTGRRPELRRDHGGNRAGVMIPTSLVACASPAAELLAGAAGLFHGTACSRHARGHRGGLVGCCARAGARRHRGRIADCRCPGWSLGRSTAPAASISAREP